jgi:hypothetical protein
VNYDADATTRTLLLDRSTDTAAARARALDPHRTGRGRSPSALLSSESCYGFRRVPATGAGRVGALERSGGRSGRRSWP